MRHFGLWFFLAFIVTSPPLSGLVLEKFIESAKEKKTVKKFKRLDTDAQNFLRQLYRGHLFDYELQFLRDTLNLPNLSDIEHPYFKDVLEDEDDKAMPWWNLQDIRKIVAYGPLFFKANMTDYEKTLILIELYHGHLIQRQDFRPLAIKLAEAIATCHTGTDSYKDARITSALLALCNDAHILDQQKFEVIKAAATFIQTESRPDEVLTTLAEEIPSFYKGIQGSHANLAITFLKILPWAMNPAGHIKHLRKYLKPESRYLQRLKYIENSVH